MSIFTYPVHGLPVALVGQEPPYLTNPDRLIYRPFLSVAVAARHRIGVGPYRWAELQLDTGADSCLLRQWIADDLVIPRPPNALVLDFHTASGTFPAWFTQVAFRLGLPTDPIPFEWTAPVGFVADDQLPQSARSGIFGIGGGLERFLRTELVLSPVGSEMPVVRVYTPG